MKIAVVIHAFHKESFKTIQKYLDNLTTKIDVFATGPDISNVIVGPIKYLSVAEVTENNGMDSLPFVYIVNKYQLWKYDLVVKLHTKNTNSEASIRMMRIYLEHLLTDDALAELERSFLSRGDSIGLWGPVPFARSVEKLVYRNSTHLQYLKQRTGLYCTDEQAIFFAGNMFCVRGVLLRKLSDNYDAFKCTIKADTGSTRTGQDGSLAHALERFIAYVISNQSYETGYIYSKGYTSNDRLAIIPSRLMPYKQYIRYFQAGSNDTSFRSEKISDFKKLDYRTTVNIWKYADFVDPERVLGIDYIAHYLMFSDYLEIPFDIELDFSSAMYRLERQDVFRAGIPSPFHYLERGRKERPELYSGSWVMKFVTKYLRDVAVPINGQIKESFREQLRDLGQFNCRISGRQCEPLSRESQDLLVERKINMSVLFEYHIPDLLRTRDIIKLQVEHGDYLGAGVSADEFSKKAFLTPDLAEIIAIADTLKFNWNSASHYWNIVQQTKKNKNLLPSFDGSKLINYDADYNPAHIFQDRLRNSWIGPHNNALPSMDRICVYTSLFGDYDDLPEIQCETPVDLAFIAFTDHFHTKADKRWKQIICKPDGDSNNLSAKKYKIKPHIYLSQYENSLFVDANTVFTGDIFTLIAMLYLNGPFAMWRHPLRTDLFMEANAIIASGRANPTVIINQVASYEKMGIGYHTGLCEGSFIWRRHVDEKVIAFMEEWWSHIINYSHRDQLSLCYLMWRDNYYPTIMDDSLGTSRENVFFYKKKLHKSEMN